MAAWEERAEQEYRRAINEGQPSASLLNDFGDFCYVQGRLEDAGDHLKRAIQLDPEHGRAPINLALVQAAEGDFESAYQLFRTSVGPAAAHQNIGLLMLRNGKEQQAVAHLEQARTIDPSLHAAEILAAAVDESEYANRHRISSVHK